MIHFRGSEVLHFPAFLKNQLFKLLRVVSKYYFKTTYKYQSGTAKPWYPHPRDPKRGAPAVLNPTELIAFAPLQNHKPGGVQLFRGSWAEAFSSQRAGVGQQLPLAGTWKYKDLECVQGARAAERGNDALQSVCPSEHNGPMSWRTWSGHAAPARAHRRLRCWRSAPDFSISPHQLPVPQSTTDSLQEHFTNSSFSCRGII